MKGNVFVGILVVAVIVVIVSYMFLQSSRSITSYEDCVAAGYPILKSKPPQCKTPDGRIFVQGGSVGNFCGSSTYGSCITDADCMSAGCSGQICQSTTEENAITTCEWKECYNAESFGLGCGCVNNQCQWALQSCTSDADCREGFSCWYQLGGPGIPGSPEQPGKCYNNKNVAEIL